MKRKVKSREALLELFKKEEYTEENGEYFFGDRLGYFAEDMFKYCGEELVMTTENAEKHFDYMATTTGIGWQFKEEWLEPLESEIKPVDDEDEEDFSVSAHSQERFKKECDSEHTSEHYNFTYKLTPEDIERGEIKVDAYFVNSIWKTSLYDKHTGILFHILKSIVRFGRKKGNSLQREVDAIKVQADNLTRFIK